MGTAAQTPGMTLLHRPRRLVGDLLDLAFPATCAGCGREGEPICGECRPALDARLGLPPGVLIGLAGDIPPPLLQLEWCAPFGGTVRRALHALKYGGERRLAEPLGRAMARRWLVAGRDGGVVVPVPVHPDRARERGYDQAVLLASWVGREAGLPVAHALVRRRATRAQFSLGRTARAGNVANAFGPGPAATVALVRGRRAVLVDDVVTTGATLAACAAVLLEAGATGVAGLTVARER